MSTAQEISQALIGAVTASLSGDAESAAALRNELLANHNHDDVLEAAIALPTVLLTMLGNEQDQFLQELARWVAETD